MTSKKQKTSAKRLVACLAVVALLLCTMGVIANAATDGAVTQAISEAASQAVEVAESFSKKIHVLVNGEKFEADVKIEEHTGEDGNTYYTGEISIPGGDSDTVQYEFDKAEGDMAFGVGQLEIVLNDSIEDSISTTAEAE